MINGKREKRYRGQQHPTFRQKLKIVPILILANRIGAYPLPRGILRGIFLSFGAKFVTVARCEGKKWNEINGKRPPEHAKFGGAGNKANICPVEWPALKAR